MSKKLMYTILGALFIFGVLFLLWSWLFSGSTNKAAQNTGQFGTASDANQTSTNSGNNGNGQTNLGQAGNGQNAANGSVALNGSGTGGTNGSGGTNGVSGTYTSTGTGGATLGQGGTIGGVGTPGVVTPHGVVWTGSGSAFTPASINSLANGNGAFNPTITSTNGGGSGGTSLITALAGAAIAGSLTCALPSAIAAISGSGAGASAGAGGVGVAVSVGTGVPVSDAATHVATNIIATQQTTQGLRNASKDSYSVVNCLTNVIAKVALQQITISVVNWINSGFNGQPSFVNNFEQFFTNVADLAAGQFIKGSALSFLCSPFKAQIKIAIAQSYAKRNNAQSCSLTGIIKNVNGFMNGSFSQGGWPGFVQFTTVPTNNPYGAYAYAQAGLAGAQSQALTNAKNNVSPTGFLNLQKITCANGTNSISTGFSAGTNAQAAVSAGQAALPAGCKASVTTPGSVIADSLGAVNKSGVDQLGLASDIDQIISALTTQLMTKILQNGLTSLSQSTTQTPADLAAQQQAANLLIDMQSRITIAQQVGSVDQQSISDIETAQSSLASLNNCWSAVAAQSTANAANAQTQADNASSTLMSLNAQIERYNNDITRLNTQIATINDFESRVSSASTQSDVAGVASSYNATVAAGAFVSQSDLTTAQQNRTTLQSQMAALNQATASSLQQCQATH